MHFADPLFMEILTLTFWDFGWFWGIFRQTIDQLFLDGFVHWCLLVWSCTCLTKPSININDGLVHDPNKPLMFDLSVVYWELWPKPSFFRDTNLHFNWWESGQVFMAQMTPVCGWWKQNLCCHGGPNMGKCWGCIRPVGYVKHFQTSMNPYDGLKQVESYEVKCLYVALGFKKEAGNRTPCQCQTRFS